MKLLCIYPAMSKKFNDYAHVLIYLKKMGVDLTIIASRCYRLKSNERSPDYEDMDGIPIYRIYENFSEQVSFPVKKYDQVLDIAIKFKPDIIMNSQQLNMHIAHKLKKDLGIPIILVVEYAKNPFKLINRRWYLGLKPFGYAVAKVYWRWLSRQSSAIITSFVGDKKYLKELSKYDTPVYYVPWCNQIPPEIENYNNKKNKYRGIYIGSISQQKNTNEFEKTIPIILQHTPIKQFMVVGPGSGVSIINNLRQQYKQQIKYLESLSRIEALKLIQSSFFSYTPVKEGGWGFIGDSWGVKTPLIVTHNEYEFNDRKDALVVDRLENIANVVNELYHDDSLYRTLQEKGYERYRKFHSAESIAQSLYKIISDTINSNSR